MTKKSCILSCCMSFITIQAIAQYTPVMIKDINPGIVNSDPSDFINVNGTLFFRAYSGGADYELWKSDGTATGTVRVKELPYGGRSAIALNNTLYFVYGGMSNDDELWKSDGTDAGTVMVKDIWAGTSASEPTGLVSLNNNIYFFATDDIHGRELWKSDGTSGGTVLVKDIRPGIYSSPSNGSNVSNGGLTEGNGTLYFSAMDDYANGYELWKSDETIAGTVMVKDISQDNATSSEPNNFTNVNSIVFFTATDDTHGKELWKTDGTESGTLIIKDIKTGSIGSSPSGLTNVNSTLFFLATDDINGEELWVSDGTTGGTVLVKDINPGSSNAAIENMTSVNGMLYFTAFDGQSRGLWKSDGTASGTVMVLNHLSTSSNDKFVDFDGFLFFPANDGNNGVELWKTDGTAAGTIMIDIYPGSASSNMSQLTDINGTLFFAAKKAGTGIELWKLTNTSTNLDNYNSHSAIKLYPNPANDMVTVANIPNDATIIITDIAGKVVYKSSTGKNQQTMINTSGLSKGVYIIQVKGKGVVSSNKLIIGN